MEDAPGPGLALSEILPIQSSADYAADTKIQIDVFYTYIVRNGGGIRVRYQDLGELRKEVIRLLERGSILVDYHHMLEEGHRVADWEIETALLDGVLEFHEDIEGRYVAKYARKREGVVITVFFEIHDTAKTRYIFVPTAFGPRR